MSSFTPPSINQNPYAAVIIDSSNKATALLNTNSEASGNLSSTINAEALTFDTSFAATSSESFIEKGKTLKTNVNSNLKEVWTCF